MWQKFQLEFMSKFLPQLRIPARYMRGGTSKGVFFNRDKIPGPGRRRDRLLLRVMGSPDRFGKQIDGMGGATSSTSKAVIVGKSRDKDFDVDYIFAQVGLRDDLVDYSGNCGNLSAAVGPFAISAGLVGDIPENGYKKVRIWQQNIRKTIIAHVPITDSEVQETGDFELDGVTFPAAEVKLEFLDPSDGPVFPTGNKIDEIDVTGLGKVRTTLINAAMPMVLLKASDFGFEGTELADVIDKDPTKLAQFEELRAKAALEMGLIHSLKEARLRQHTPKIAMVSKPRDHVVSSGKSIAASEVDFVVRAISMGKMHHAIMGTGAIALASAAVIPGTVVSEIAENEHTTVVFGHPSGKVKLTVEAKEKNGRWVIETAAMSRSARTLMDGSVCVPQEQLQRQIPPS